MAIDKRNFRLAPILSLALLLSTISCLPLSIAQRGSHAHVVEMTPIEVDPKHPERKNFGALTLLSAFHLQSKDKRFGGLSGLSVGTDGKLYAISDRGYWLSATMERDQNGTLVNLIDWQIAPLLTPANTPVEGALQDAEALTRTRDGSFLVAFEGVHRIWHYSAPPDTFESIPVPVPIPPLMARAPGNGGIEGLAVLPDRRLLALTEEFANPDGSFKGWIIDNDRFSELSYVPGHGFRVTDCAALNNGDVLVLERRYAPIGILSARLTLVKSESIRFGAKLVGKELLKLEQPLAVDNFEGLAVQETASGVMIFIVSDDNYSSFQETLLLQFLLSTGGN